MKKRYLLIIVVLIAVTFAAAIIHMREQEQIPCMRMIHYGNRIDVSFEDLDQENFSGQLMDGKGSVSQHEYRGMEIKLLLEKYGVTLTENDTVKITSADNFTASFAAREILTEGKVYVAVEADGIPIPGIHPEEKGLQIIVFGDENSRRCVRYAKIIEISR